MRPASVDLNSARCGSTVWSGFGAGTVSASGPVSVFAGPFGADSTLGVAAVS